jgi:glycosyltransferase involved in cell wall biosynthesis
MKTRFPVMLLVRELGLGGTERQTAETARWLDRSLFEPHVGCFRANGFRAEELRDAGVPVIELPAASLRNPSALKAGTRMGEYLRRHEIQLVHTFDTPMNLFGVPVARAFRVPVVLSSQRAFRELTRQPARHLLRLTDRLVDGIVVNCKAVERHLVEEERVPASLVHLCYNGIDTRLFCPGGVPRPEAIAGAALTIGVVCAVRPEKDLSTLLRAFACVRSVQPKLKLVVVGSGPSRGGLLRLSRDLGIEADCHFEPAARDVAAWMRAIDIFVLPSLSEALSNALMEAMACGCCPVASDVGGNPELVIPMQTGLLFRRGDAADLAGKLVLLAGDPVLRRMLAANAAAHIADRFSPTASAGRMGGIYCDFLEAC